jgi:CheY-like chemotaxis protein
MRLFLEQLLAPQFELCLVGDAEQGLEILQQQPFDAVLSDIHLPGLNGFELARNVQAQRPSLPVFLMTDAPIDALLSLAAATGIEHIFAKSMLKADGMGSTQLLRQLLDRSWMGLLGCLGAAGESRAYVIQSSDDLVRVQDACFRLLERFPRIDVYHYLIPELLRAALSAGQSSGVRGGDLHIQMHVGADWKKVGLGIRCLASVAAQHHLLEPLRHNLDEESQSALAGHGGALRLARTMMDLSIVSYARNGLVELTCLDLLDRYHGERSLHLIRLD